MPKIVRAQYILTYQRKARNVRSGSKLLSFFGEGKSQEQDAEVKCGPSHIRRLASVEIKIPRSTLVFTDNSAGRQELSVNMQKEDTGQETNSWMILPQRDDL